MIMTLLISHDGAVHRDTVRRWKDFAPDIKVDWVRMAQSVLRYDIVIVVELFNNGSWVLEAWKKEHPEEFEEECEGAAERIPAVEERREELHLDIELVGEGTVCGLRARHLHTTLG